jgi:hypothetical protein
MNKQGGLMSKCVLLSVRPQWCELICNGKKTIEVRKTRPKLDTPFKVYIYETRGKTDTPWIDEDGHMDFHGRGQVIGEFVCSYTRELVQPFSAPYEVYEHYFALACLTTAQAENYADGKNIYGWHISDLKIYDRPKNVGEFLVTRNFTKYWLKRPFQSWGYVEATDGQS